MTHASTLILHCSRVSNCWERNALLLESWRNKSLVFLCTLSIFCYFIFSCFFIIFHYYDNVMQILFFANAISANMLYDPSIQLSDIWCPDPAWPRAPKSGGSADPADPVLPTPLSTHGLKRPSYQVGWFSPHWLICSMVPLVCSVVLRRTGAQESGKESDYLLIFDWMLFLSAEHYIETPEELVPTLNGFFDKLESARKPLW